MNAPVPRELWIASEAALRDGATNKDRAAYDAAYAVYIAARAARQPAEEANDE